MKFIFILILINSCTNNNKLNFNKLNTTSFNYKRNNNYSFLYFSKESDSIWVFNKYDTIFLLNPKFKSKLTITKFVDKENTLTINCIFNSDDKILNRKIEISELNNNVIKINLTDVSNNSKVLNFKNILYLKSNIKIREINIEKLISLIDFECFTYCCSIEINNFYLLWQMFKKGIQKSELNNIMIEYGKALYGLKIVKTITILDIKNTTCYYDSITSVISRENNALTISAINNSKKIFNASLIFNSKNIYCNVLHYDRCQFNNDNKLVNFENQYYNFMENEFILKNYLINERDENYFLKNSIIFKTDLKKIKLIDKCKIKIKIKNNHYYIYKNLKLNEIISIIEFNKIQQFKTN